jgi:signal transduction histidine kinase
MNKFFFSLVFLANAVLAHQNVLILNSYNPGFAWTDEITKGIWDVLKENNDMKISMEYMDILTMPEQKKVYREKRMQGIYLILESKYKDTKFDVVITVGYAAFEFAKQYREILWKEIPIVSCGVNRLQAKAMELDSAATQWYGIYEFYDTSAQIDLIQRTQGDIKRIIFVTDNSQPGQDISEQLNSAMVSNQKYISVVEWKNPPWENLPAALSQLDSKQDAVVLAGVYINEPSENFHNLWQIITKYINGHSTAPVYSFWNMGVINGIVGGNVILAPLMGKNTGLLATSILSHNTDYSQKFYRSANMPIIDVQAATNRNLRFNKLPQETIRINEKDSWLNSAYQSYVSNMKNAIIAELIIILILGFSFYIYFRHSHRNLLREKKSTETASRAKSLFLATMSHEIKTPLNAMLGFSELLLNKGSNLNEEQKEWAKSIEISSYHLCDTFSNIINFSKMESGSLEIEEEWVDIFLLCDDLISVCKHYLLYKQVNLYVMPSIYIPKFIKTDPLKLKQVLVNLISNAIKFTNKGSVELYIDYLDENEEKKIRFEVIDEGIGIPKEKIKKIFNAFEQADTGHARKYGGSGLGLTISKNILQAMGSELKVQSEEKKGSNFSFQLSVKIKEKAFYQKFLYRENQKVSIYNLNKKVLKHQKECAEAIGGDAFASSDINAILNFGERDLLVAEADEFSDSQIFKISVLFPRVIFLFYKENEKIEQIKRDYPKFECLLAPMKPSEAVKSLQKLYSS